VTTGQPQRLGGELANLLGAANDLAVELALAVTTLHVAIIALSRWFR